MGFQITLPDGFVYPIDDLARMCVGVNDETGKPDSLHFDEDGNLKTTGGGGGGGGGGDASAENQEIGNASLAIIAEAQSEPGSFRSQSQQETASEIKSGAGSLAGYSFTNPNTYPVYVKFYDSLAVDVTVGTTTVIKTVPIPTDGYIIQENVGEPLIGFTTGLSIAITKLLADGDTTALDVPVSSEVYCK